MNLAPRTETLTQPENHSWLASLHGIDATESVEIDGAAFGAIYTDGIAKSGTVIAKNTVTGRYVPFNNAGSDGTNAAKGILYTTIDLRNGSGGFTNSLASLLTMGKIVPSRLPRTSGQVGGLHANAATALTGIQVKA